MKYKRVKIGRKRSRTFLICRRSFVPGLFLNAFIKYVTFWFIPRYSYFHLYSVSFFLDFIKLLEGKFYCLLFSLSLSFFHFPLLKSNTTRKYNICRKCISRFIIIFMRAIVIGLKVQLFKYDVNLYTFLQNRNRSQRFSIEFLILTLYK